SPNKMVNGPPSVAIMQQHQQQTPPSSGIGIGSCGIAATPSAAASGVAASGAPGGDLIEEGLQFLEPFVQSERSYPDLATLLGGVGDRVTLSGTDVAAYPPSPNGSGGEVSISRVTPLPGELMEKLGAMQTNCLMGVFPEASRAWLTVDNEFFLWNYEDGSDLAYYDGLQDAIVAVGFVQPRRDVFADEVHHLLCLATPLELAVLGVSYQSGQVHLLAEPLLRLPTDGQVVTCIEGSRSTGRLFAGTQSGCLLEVAYEERRVGWLSGQYTVQGRLINHSVSSLSRLVPSFISSLAAADDPICQVCVDDSRRLVYTRSQESTVFAYALSAEAGDTAARRVAALRGSDLAAHAARIAHMVDRSCLTDIVHLSPLTAQHSAMLYLMAVTGSGVRFYFDARLRLAHVRLGPMCPSLPRLADIRLATESRGTVLMLASRGEDRDTLYVLSPDPFPRRPQLQEACSVAWPPGRAWIMCCLPSPQLDYRDIGIDPQLHDGPLVGRPYPPVFLTQHVDPVRRFLLVSVHGLVLLELQTPLMRLAGLLAANQPDSRPVTDWFAHFGPEESSCVCLILACCDSDDLVRERALAAVMLHGTAAAVRDAAMAASIDCQTPVPSSAAAADPSANALLSGLSRYAARVLLPLWYSPIVSERRGCFLVSRLESDELGWFSSHLTHLFRFVQSNLAQLSASARGRVEAESQQRAYKLLQLISTNLELLNLWKLLAEHQFYLVARRLTEDERAHLRGTRFRDLLLAKNRLLLNRLIACLLEHYLADSASVDSISNKLQEACSSLYTPQDALCAKANEMLQAAAGEPLDRRTSLLAEAGRLYREAGTSVSLADVLPRLEALQAYETMAGLCLALAKQWDPQDRALHFTREGRKPHTEADADAVAGRHGCYQALLDICTRLRRAATGAGAATVPAAVTPRPVGVSPHSSAAAAAAAAAAAVVSQSPAKAQQGQHEMARVLDNVIRVTLNSDDMLAHYEMFNWLSQHGMTEQMLSHDSPHLESYLRNRLRKTPEDQQLRELLCRHLKRCGKVLEAARILEHLAVAACDTADLAQRQAYLAQAIVDAKSRPGEGIGELLQQLEDELDTATVQAAVLEELQQRYPQSAASPEMAEAVRRLNGQLFPLTELYAEFAAPLRLPLAKLRIVASAGHRDQALVNQLWEELLDRELAGPAGFRAVQQTLARLGRSYSSGANGEDFFPAVQIVATLEKRAIEARLEEGWVVNAFCQFDYPLHRLAQAYDQLLRRRAGDPVWQSLRGYHQLLRSLICLLAKFQRAADSMPARNRQRAASQFLDMISSYQVDLRSHTDAMSVNISQRLAQIRDDLARMA
ncbi:hypothetical protein BOX15_Mlig004589g4, partial [Macrostomum lignano]